MDNLTENLRAIVGRDAVLSEPGELIVYECDGLPQHKYPPRAVVFPSSTEQTAAVMRVLADARVAFTPRGAGTGLSGGALALDGGVVIELARMRKVLSIDEGNRTAVVQTGVVNAHVSKAVAHLGLHYVPDPSSQGKLHHRWKPGRERRRYSPPYGTTTDHVMGVRVVLAGGEIVDLGSSELGRRLPICSSSSVSRAPSELPGNLRLKRCRRGAHITAEFPLVNDANHAVLQLSRRRNAGALVMDGEIIRAVERVFCRRPPLDIGAAAANRA